MRSSIDEKGRMTELAKEYKGLSTEECKEEIIADLKAKGLLTKRERIKQSVGVCWRCKAPIEIISTRQWFVKVKKEEIIKAAREIKWYPEYFAVRLKNWVESMDWDWCISRQRIFGVPIPVWYCKRCGAVKIAEEAELPIDPLTKSPKKPCTNCGCSEFEGEEDILDTWMDSSLTALWVAGWDFSFSFNSEASSEFDFKPVELRPQGHDIIRTWAFYSVLRSIALTNKIPWRTIIINGMVLGEDGYKMSESRNNIILPEDVIQKFGADVFRQWAAVGGAVGSDVQFRRKDIVAARRFLQKRWSILRFSMIHLSSFECEEKKIKELNLRIIDKWLLSKLNRLVGSVTDSMEDFKFDEAMKNLRAFIWTFLADDYIELVKSRLYGILGDEGKESAKYTLYEAIKTLSILLAPFILFFAEEMHSCITRGEDVGGGKGRGNASVHEEKWPEAKHELIDPEVEKEIIEVADKIDRDEEVRDELQAKLFEDVKGRGIKKG